MANTNDIAVTPAFVFMIVLLGLEFLVSFCIASCDTPFALTRNVTWRVWGCGDMSFATGAP